MQSTRKNVVRLLAVVLVMIVPATASSQQLSPNNSATRPQTPAPTARPPAQPVQSPQPVQAPHALQAQAQPTTAALEVPESTTATYADWVVQCQTRSGSPPEKVCDMAQVTQLQGRNVPFSRVAIAHPVKGQPIKLVLQVPVNVSFATNVRLQIGDTDPGIAAPFARCVPAGCFAEFDLKDDLLRKFRVASSAGKLSFADAGGHDIAVPLAFNGFTQAFDALAKE